MIIKIKEREITYKTGSLSLNLPLSPSIFTSIHFIVFKISACQKNIRVDKYLKNETRYSYGSCALNLNFLASVFINLFHSVQSILRTIIVIEIKEKQKTQNMDKQELCVSSTVFLLVTSCLNIYTGKNQEGYNLNKGPRRVMSVLRQCTSTHCKKAGLKSFRLLTREVWFGQGLDAASRPSPGFLIIWSSFDGLIKQSVFVLKRP